MNLGDAAAVFLRNSRSSGMQQAGYDGSNTSLLSFSFCYDLELMIL